MSFYCPFPFGMSVPTSTCHRRPGILTAQLSTVDWHRQNLDVLQLSPLYGCSGFLSATANIVQLRTGIDLTDSDLTAQSIPVHGFDHWICVRRPQDSRPLIRLRRPSRLIDKHPSLHERLRISGRAWIFGSSGRSAGVRFEQRGSDSARLLEGALICYKR